MHPARQLLGLVLGRREAAYDGRVSLAGLEREVTIRRDDYAVPYISASSWRDAWFALGFCHAQDRAAQLELIVRAVRGTLAEMIGAEGIAVDRLSRRIGFRRSAEAQLACALPEVIEQITSYVAGVNAGLERTPRPHELALLQTRSSRWQPADVQGYSALLCFMLASNWDAELMRLKVLELDGPEALAAIDPCYPSHLPTSAEPLGRAIGSAADSLAADLTAWNQAVGYGGGSNAWAVAPHKTSTGRPLLANDLHLMSALPVPTYLAQLRAPDLAVAGASWVGVPAFAPGHNGHSAWGVTAAHADNTDLFLERIGADGESVVHDGRLERCETREELIRVRAGRALRERVLVTERGPIIAFGDASAKPPHHDKDALIEPPLGRGAISFAATWLAPRRYTGLYLAHRARSFDAFRQLFAAGSTSTVSAVYADETGSIGWHLAVEVPKRRAGDGTVPMPGWERASGWDGIIPFEALPRVTDPPWGFVCTANNQPAAAGSAFGADFLDGYRQAAIAERLAGRDDWDLPETLALQRNVASLPWRELAPVVLRLAPTCRDSDLALSLLRAWDGNMSRRSVAASIFALFCAELTERIISAKAPRSARWALGQPFTGLLPITTLSTRRMGHVTRLVREQPPGYFDDWPATLRSCLAAAVRRLRQRHGHDARAWQWGRVRPLVMQHAFTEKSAALGHVFDIGPLAGEGDNTTISQGGVDYATPVSRQAWAPVLRAAIDVGNWDACRFAMVAGQSGNPLSRHYADQVAPWRDGGVEIAWSEPRIAERAVHELRLTPAAARRWWQRRR
jgi:penicillin amidase